MCGIFGWVGATPKNPHEIAERMAALLRHRGPDDQGIEVGTGWGLGFRRLSILDLSVLGHQPMSFAQGRFWLIFNGEIYNYVELRHALEAEGEQFQSGSDTEVLLRLLVRKGAAALPLLNGMFGLAFIDTEQRTFLLARDRLGVKPLYYRMQVGQLCFASELKSLLAWPDAPRQINHAAIVEYLALHYLSSETCIYQGYHKLPAGHLLTGSLDHPADHQIVPYWQLRMERDPAQRNLTGAEFDTLLALLTDAVRIRLRSDVPVGVFLSGGIDSGLVATLASQAGGVAPLALTVGYSEQDYDETALARATAEHAGLEHRVIMQQPSELADIDRLAWFYDEPFGDSSALPTYALCQAAAQHATVFLSGDGGDEAFGGYRRYVEVQRLRPLIQMPALAAASVHALAGLLPELSLARYRMLKLGLPDHGGAAAFDELPSDPAIAAVLHPDLRHLAGGAGRAVWQRWQQSRGATLTTRQQQFDYALYLPDDILVKMDRASMAHSIEVRSPFLDYRVVEWAARLPESTLLNSRQGKLPLRALGERLLPADVQQGRKRGFGVPLDQWLRKPDGQRFVRERLLAPEARQSGLYDPVVVEKLLVNHGAQGGREYGGLLWRLLMLDAWARQYLRSSSFMAGPPIV